MQKVCAVKIAKHYTVFLSPSQNNKNSNTLYCQTNQLWAKGVVIRRQLLTLNSTATV